MSCSECGVCLSGSLSLSLCDSHLFRGDSHARSDHVQGVRQHGSRGARQRSCQEAGHGGQGPATDQSHNTQLGQTPPTTCHSVFVCRGAGSLLPLGAAVPSQQPLVLLMGAELDASVGNDSHHGG